MHACACDYAYPCYVASVIMKAWHFLCTFTLLILLVTMHAQLQADCVAKCAYMHMHAQLQADCIAQVHIITCTCMHSRMLMHAELQSDYMAQMSIITSTCMHSHKLPAWPKCAQLKLLQSYKSDCVPQMPQLHAQHQDVRPQLPHRQQDVRPGLVRRQGQHTRDARYTQTRCIDDTALTMYPLFNLQELTLYVLQIQWLGDQSSLGLVENKTRQISPALKIAVKQYTSQNAG